MLRSAVLLVTIVGGLAGSAVAATINVPADQPDIQSAIDAAADGDTIVVADGVYTGPGNKNLLFAGRSVTLRSANGSGACVIDCEDDGRAFFISGQDPHEIVVAGFTVTRGYVDDTYVGGRKGGAGIISASSPTIMDCVFEANHGHTGSGLYINSGGSATLINCRITNNVFVDDGTKSDIHVGAGLLVRMGATPTLINCTIAGNITAPGSDHRGGALYANTDADVALHNCILWGNDATAGDQIAVANGASVTVSHCLVEGGEPAVFVAAGTLTWGPGNIDADPAFVDPGGGDYALSASSPAIDAGDNTVVPLELVGDVDGNPRFADDPDVPNTGVPDARPPIDLGAYERVRVTCAGDVDGSGAVGFGDLLAVLNAWGPCPGCPEDVDGDGVVGFGDVLAVLGAWGDCERPHGAAGSEATRAVALGAEPGPGPFARVPRCARCP